MGALPFCKEYCFLEQEKFWQQWWQDQKLYAWDSAVDRKDTFVVDTPPPTVSGQLHMGHVCSYTQTDFIVRFQRMLGKNIFYPIGFDDNGLPTERLVERVKGVRAKDVDRQSFQQLCKAVVDEAEGKFRLLFKTIALSVDWALEYQTISPLSCKLSQMSFLDLLKKGEIYRNEQPILWDPGDGTALSQADLEDRPMEGVMNVLQFCHESTNAPLLVATTRPELLQACVALFYNPDDSRYQELENSYALTPFFHKKVPILKDYLVQPEKGTGLVMCCTFGDKTDVIWWKTHQLPTKVILNQQACIIVEGPVKGLKVLAARAKMIEFLKAQQCLIKQTPIAHHVSCAERSGEAIEILPIPQWFLRTLAHKQALLTHAQALNWYPHSMKQRLVSWINGLAWDWCISRQRYFGVPIPVWYSKRAGEQGKLLLPTIEQLPVDPYYDLPIGYSRQEVEPDGHVMDTWATSSLSPQLSSHALNQDFAVDYKRHEKLFPMDLRPQAHEIIRTWAFYTLLKSHLHANSLPWRTIMVHGWCLASDQSKMSKSKGNVVIPEQVLDKYGADVVRYWAAHVRLGVDTCYCEYVMKNGKRLVTKLWNVGRFIAQHIHHLEQSIRNQTLQENRKWIIEKIDQWLLQRLIALIDQAKAHWMAYGYTEALEVVEAFFWGVFCNDYMELIKARIYANHADHARASALVTLYHGFYELLKLFAPILPYITETLAQALYADKGSVHQRGNWSCFAFKALIDPISQAQVEQLRAVLHGVRKVKAEQKLSVKAPVELITIYGPVLTEDLVQELKAVTMAKEVVFTNQLIAHPGIVIKDKTCTLWVLLN